MDDNIICKSYQRGNLDSSGMYDIAPNSDIVLVLLSCQRLIPDGAKLFEGLDVAVDIATLGI